MKIFKPKTPQQIKKERLRAEALAAYAAKCKAMDDERLRVGAIISVTAREIMQKQLDEINSGPPGFTHKEHDNLVRQIRELDGLD